MALQHSSCTVREVAPKSEERHLEPLPGIPVCHKIPSNVNACQRQRDFATGVANGSSPPSTFVPGMDETSECHEFARSNTPTYLNQRVRC